MNGRLAKKVRKQVNKKVRYDLTEVVKVLSEAKLHERIGYALRIVFKYKLGERLKIKHG